MRKTGLVVVIAIVGLTLGATGAAHAGGWAIVALDPIPGTPVEGQPFTVGFTILQHGVTPYTTANASIVVTDTSGRVEQFAATPVGAPGHHTAVVTFAKAGSYRWDVVPDWFAKQPLGDIEVTAANVAAKPATTTGQNPPSTTVNPAPPPTTLTTTTTTTTSSRDPFSVAVRVLLGVATAVALGAMIADQQSRRRRAAV
jgi:hypothetical protein